MTELSIHIQPPAPEPRDIRLVAIDIDGTLLRTDKRLSQVTVDAVVACTRRGVKVVLASARPPRSVREIHELLALDTVSIHYNGALIHDLRRSKNLIHQPMGADLAREIILDARRLDPQCLVSIEILDKWYTDHFDPELPTETSRAFNPDFIGPIDAFLKVPVTKLMLLGPPHRLNRVWKMVQRRYRQRVAMAVSDAHLIQIMHPEVDKATALAQVAAGYGVTGAQVMAIGDAPNDKRMLEWAGLGVAMGNAWEAVREAADVVVPANDEDGVAHALQRFVLQGS
jgi:Cof subfamily protein (haloacid dehalogenase superfamily)